MTIESNSNLKWQGPKESISYEENEIFAKLWKLNETCYLISDGGRVGAVMQGEVVSPQEEGLPLLAMAHPYPGQQLGEASFRAAYGVDYAYMTGAMANAIAGEEMVIALGKAGLLSSFGAGGLPPGRLESAIQRIQSALPQGPYAFNLIHSPNEPALEEAAVDLFLEHQVRVIEASAYLRLTPHIVRYRAAGLSQDGGGGAVKVKNRIIAKLSRREVAERFLRPAPDKLLRRLVEAGHITSQQAQLASQVPMADDITVEADSGGHTDNRPLVNLLPSIIALRDQIQNELRYPAGPGGRSGRDQHAYCGLGRFYDGRGLCGHRLGQPGLPGSGHVGARQRTACPGGDDGRDDGPGGGYV
ncbi:MAG: Polyketide biosynthesis protein PksE [Chloroflexi bacterium]|nr:Polyketide biosynthesis protein PksE [Chloroflexota bacterium]